MTEGTVKGLRAPGEAGCLCLGGMEQASPRRGGGACDLGLPGVPGGELGGTFRQKYLKTRPVLRSHVWGG